MTGGSIYDTTVTKDLQRLEKDQLLFEVSIYY